MVTLMHFDQTTSWQIREDLDYSLTLALYVRDAAGLTPYVAVEQDIPPLLPVVPAQRHDIDLGVAAREWPQWWVRALQRPVEPPLLPEGPGWDELDDLPVVRRLAEQQHRHYWTWMGAAKAEEIRRARSDQAMHLTRFVNAFEARLSRPVRPFRLHLRVLPVDAAAGWVLDEQQVLVTSRLLDDPVALEQVLGPVVSVLA